MDPRTNRRFGGELVAGEPEGLRRRGPDRNARVYLRYDPISAPALALLKPTPATTEAPAEGESMERIAVRTFNDTPAKNTIPSTQHARRAAVPPRTTHRDAEQHGMLDQAGIVDPAFFTMLAAKDHSLLEQKLLLAGPLDKNPPVATGFAVWQQGEALPYLPEPLAVTVAARIFGHPDIDPNKIIQIPLYAGSAKWPDAAPFKIELYEKPGDLPKFDAADRTLFIPLPKAVRATLRLSIMPTLEMLRLLGVWNWLTDAQRSPLLQKALDGQHWMLTPWRHIELVHATQKPLVDPDIVKHDIDRDFASTFARPNFVLHCGISSTSHLDLLARWNEPTEEVGAVAAGANRERNDRAFAVKISEPDGYQGQPDYHLEGNDLIRAGGVFHDLVQKKIHEFHDTRYRRIEYHFEATTKFREFMPAKILTELVGGNAQPTDKNIKVSGKTLRTWIKSSAPPPAPEVLYVVPTFGWVRDGTSGNENPSWRRGGGLRVYLNRKWNESGYGEMLAAIVPSERFAGDPMTEPAAQPLKNFVTQWGNDPIWQTPFVPGVAPRPANFPLARTAPDPAGAWLPAFAPPTESDQPPGAFSTSGLPHPAQKLANAQTNVDVAPHDVFYDPDRRLWLCDIEVDFGTTYYPFVHLALARSQPVSVPGAHLSNIVLADFMALTPDRSLTVTPTAEPKTRRVHVYGPTFTDSGAHVEAKNAPQATSPLPGSGVIVKAPDVASSSVVEVWVERLDPSMGQDFGWKRDAKAVVTKDTTRLPTITVSRAQRARATSLVQKRQFDVLINEGLVHVIVRPTLWSGSVTLPDAPGGAKRYRLVIAVRGVPDRRCDTLQPDSDKEGSTGRLYRARGGHVVTAIGIRTEAIRIRN